MARRQWTSVDFSGCTLASGVTDKQVIVILSLWVTITSESDELDIQSLEQQVIMLVCWYIIVCSTILKNGRMKVVFLSLGIIMH